MKRRQFLKSLTFALPSVTILGRSTGWSITEDKDRPNVLWITCEDMSLTLGCYGDVNAYTPFLDKFAAESIRYTNAFATAPLCTPARSSIITGIFASTLGTQHLRGEMPLSPLIKCYPEYLREAGYYCTNNVKEDYNFKTPKTVWDESSDTAHWQNRPQGKPFFSIFNLMTTHQSRVRYEKEELDKVNKELHPDEIQNPEKIMLPPYYPDTPRVRINMAAFYTQVTLMDKQVGEILSRLHQDGLEENTIVFFYSDHGTGLPRGKRWLHETGIKVPLLIRIPEKYKWLATKQKGATEDRLVSFVDFPATILSIAGIKPPSRMHGKAFLGSFEEKPREAIFAIRDRVDEVLELSRTIHDFRFQYIRNFIPHRPRMQTSFYSELTPIRQELHRLFKEGHLKGDQLWLMSSTIPVDELYDSQNDLWQMNNLAEKTEYSDKKIEMKKKLFDWMLETRDLSLLHENDMIERAHGRMPYEYGADDSIYPMEKILKIADMVGRGEKYRDDLSNALFDNDSAVRYWGATGLAALGDRAIKAEKQLITALQDEKSWVRFAAAEACCNIGQEESALDVLAKGLLLENVKERLHAAEILVAIDSKAKPLIPEMKQAIKSAQDLQDHGWYMREALSYLVEKLETR